MGARTSRAAIQLLHTKRFGRMGDLAPATGDQSMLAQGTPAPAGVRLSLADIGRRAAMGDEAAIAELFTRRFDLVYLAAKRATRRDESFCLDAVQEVFVRIMRTGGGRAMAGLRDDEAVDRWLTCVARAAALDLLRSESRRTRREKTAGARASAGTSGATDAEQIAWLERKMASLSAEEHELVHLRGAGATLNVIAERIGLTIGTVQGRLRRTLHAMSKAGKESDHERRSR